ncbi:MAG TPA: hypothetical protein PKJ08_13430, partial [Candidatus Cloacimonadota bacterium]|nr:hypothetical protein [Candidatus Cloacimonadota bacterium]
MKKAIGIFFIVMLFFSICYAEDINQNITIGSTGNFQSIQAAINHIAANVLTNNIDIIIQSTYSVSNETFPITISSNFNTSIYSVTFKTLASISLQSTTTEPVLILDGCKNVVFDGRIDGSGQNITLSNTNVSGNVIQLKNSANNNTLRNLNIKGINSSTSSGLVLFSTAGAGTGNNNNTVEYCNISREITDPVKYPCNLIYSAGTLNSPNTGNIIQHNKLFDYTKTDNANSDYSASVFLHSNNSSWIINSNTIYQSTTLPNASALLFHCGIYIHGQNNFNSTITNNVIGGENLENGGSWKYLSHSKYIVKGISITNPLQAPSASSENMIQNNTIKN